MSDVVITGAGMVPFGKHHDRSVEDLAQAAILAALQDGGVRREEVGEAFCGSVYGGMLIGQRVLRDLGMMGMPITNIENACSSGATALRDAVAAVVLGRCDTALAFGVEKLSALGGGTIPLEATDLEVGQGMVMPALYAMRARRYMHETGVDTRTLAQVVVKARAHAAHNPYAQLRTSVTVEDVLGSRMIADPLTLFMCCPTCDGAAAVIVRSGVRARRSGATPVRVAASVLQSGYYKTGFRDMTSAELTVRTSRLAYEQAGLGPADLSLAEVHDAFSIAELMYYEALGLCGPGEGKELLGRGDTALGGRIPVNPSGGLLSRGHPLGATGLAQVCEAVWQLRGQAGARQVPDARVALTHCTGGGISGVDHGACSVHIFTR